MYSMVEVNVDSQLLAQPACIDDASQSPSRVRPSTWDLETEHLTWAPASEQELPFARGFASNAIQGRHVAENAALTLERRNLLARLSTSYTTLDDAAEVDAAEVYKERQEVEEQDEECVKVWTLTEVVQLEMALPIGPLNPPAFAGFARSSSGLAQDALDMYQSFDCSVHHVASDHAFPKFAGGIGELAQDDIEVQPFTDVDVVSVGLVPSAEETPCEDELDGLPDWFDVMPYKALVEALHEPLSARMPSSHKDDELSAKHLELQSETFSGSDAEDVESESEISSVGGLEDALWQPAQTSEPVLEHDVQGKKSHRRISSQSTQASEARCDQDVQEDASPRSLSALDASPPEKAVAEQGEAGKESEDEEDEEAQGVEEEDIAAEQVGPASPRSYPLTRSPTTHRKSIASMSEACSPVLLHVYDVSQHSSIQWLNSVFANECSPVKFGGMFHVGVEVYGREWMFGYSADGCGIAHTGPLSYGMHHFRETINMGSTELSASEVACVVHALRRAFPGLSYHLTQRNCCHFADALCQGLGVGSIPAWICRLAAVGDAPVQLLQRLEGLASQGFLHLISSAAPSPCQSHATAALCDHPNASMPASPQKVICCI